MGKIKAVREMENFSSTDFNTILESLEAKMSELDHYNEKISAQMTAEDVQEEIVEAEIYMLDLKLKIRQLSGFRDKMSTQPRSETAA